MEEIIKKILSENINQSIVNVEGGDAKYTVEISSDDFSGKTIIERHKMVYALLDKYIKLAPSEPVAKYWAMCEWFDKTVGDLMNYLKNNSLEENTLIVYTADNGWIQSNKRNRYAPRSKRAPHEGGIRTPIMFKLPKVIEPEMNTSTLVSNIDLVPTVLDFLDITGEELSGISVMEKEKLNTRETLFIECYHHDILNVERPTETVLYKVALNKKWKLMLPNTKMIVREFTQPEEQYYLSLIHI